MGRKRKSKKYSTICPPLELTIAKLRKGYTIWERSHQVIEFIAGLDLPAGMHHPLHIQEQIEIMPLLTSILGIAARRISRLWREKRMRRRLAWLKELKQSKLSDDLIELLFREWL
jgi:hypothetical protein